MRRASILLIALAMFLLSAAAALANNTWNGYHWPDGAGDDHNGPISLTLVDDLSEYGAEYTAVLADWDSGLSGKGPLSLSSSKADPKDRPEKVLLALSRRRSVALAHRDVEQPLVVERQILNVVM